MTPELSVVGIVVSIEYFDGKWEEIGGCEGSTNYVHLNFSSFIIKPFSLYFLAIFFLLVESVPTAWLFGFNIFQKLRYLQLIYFIIYLWLSSFPIYLSKMTFPIKIDMNILIKKWHGLHDFSHWKCHGFSNQ